jgi:hypothetical protein
VGPNVFAGKKHQADEQEQYALKDWQKEACDAQEDKTPARCQNQPSLALLIQLVAFPNSALRVPLYLGVDLESTVFKAEHAGPNNRPILLPGVRINSTYTPPHQPKPGSLRMGLATEKVYARLLGLVSKRAYTTWAIIVRLVVLIGEGVMLREWHEAESRFISPIRPQLGNKGGGTRSFGDELKTNVSRERLGRLSALLDGLRHPLRLCLTAPCLALPYHDQPNRRQQNEGCKIH